MLVRPGFKPATSRSADWRSPNWANQVAVFFFFLHLTVTFLFLLFIFFICFCGYQFKRNVYVQWSERLRLVPNLDENRFSSLRRPRIWTRRTPLNCCCLHIYPLSKGLVFGQLFFRGKKSLGAHELSVSSRYFQNHWTFYCVQTLGTLRSNDATATKTSHVLHLLCQM